MKILIKSFRLSSNYGCILQAYAIQKVLKDMGHDVITWDTDMPFYKRMSRSHRVLSIAKQVIRKYVQGQKNIIIDIDGFAAERSALSNKYTKLFVEKHITRLVADNINSIDGRQFDCVVAGSDQIWRHYGDDKSLKNNFLEFANSWNCKRIAYAASFGNDKISYSRELKEECKHLINMFDAVSVRELSGVDICKTEFGVDATHVLDPTMLLSKEDYLSLIDNRQEQKNEGDLLAYILDESDDKKQIVKYVSQQLGLCPFSVNAESDNTEVPFDWRIQPPVEEWIYGFSKAKYVITDSFHACVFAIIFNKPFLCIGNVQRGMARYISLLSMFNLQNRIVRDVNFSDENYTSFIDWDFVNDELRKRRKTSLVFLSTLLK